MTAKQLSGTSAPDGSKYITLTDGAGNLVLPGAITSNPITLTTQAYTTTVADLNKVAQVTSGVSDSTITLISAVTAGDGAIQYVQKVDDGSQSVTGAADNGSTLIRITVASTSGMVTNQWKTINKVTGCAEANGTWKITVVSATTFDLQGSLFANTYVSGGAVNGGRVVVTDGSSDLAWLSSQFDIVALRSNGTTWQTVGWQIKPLREYYRATGAVTWTKAPITTRIRVYGVGGGSGGGSGARRATGGIRTGGAGGAAGQSVWMEFPTSQLGSTETITNVVGGAGGLAISVDATNGNSGTVPANATFGSHLTAVAGAGVVSGDLAITAPSGGTTANAAAATSANIRSNWGLPGGGATATSTANGAQPAGASGANGGGAGGGADAANVQRLPGIAGLGSILAGTVTAAGIAGTAGNPGGNGGNVTNFDIQTGGAGGGGGFFVASTAGTIGGLGGNPGGGGGGGGASDNGTASGAGGKGGDSAFLVVQYFS